MVGMCTHLSKLRTPTGYKTINVKCPEASFVEYSAFAGWLTSTSARYDTRMKTAQAGIFALGTASHAYLEFDALNQSRGEELVAAFSALREPRTTIGGVNLVVGFRPELWNKAAPGQTPAGIQGFNTEIIGKDGFACPPHSTMRSCGFQEARTT